MGHPCIPLHPTDQLAQGVAIPLARLRPGDEATVVRIAGGTRLARRLSALGFTPGVTVRVVARPGAPAIVSVRGCRLGMGQQVLERIWVTPEQ